MTKQLALKIILGIGIAGALFSGYLSYKELFETCPLSCPAVGASGTILGYPACIYGFAMYAILTTVAVIGLHAKKNTADSSESAV
jgi:hypothetical protein